LNRDPVTAVTELQHLRHSTALVYAVDQVEASDVYVLYECLRGLGPVKRLDVVLHTAGGDIDITRRIAHLLREHCDELRILVPDHAQSAGTLLCLAADELVLGPMAALGPVDAHLTSTGERGAGPGRISAEEVRVLPDVAREWFGLDEATARVQGFAAVNQRIFPTTLGAFYRADRNVRRIGAELLVYQLPSLNDDDRRSIVNRLVEGYDGHGHVITRREAQSLGLNVSFPAPDEEALMWECTWPLRRGYTEPFNDEPQWGLILAGNGFTARRVQTAVPTDASPHPIPTRYWKVESADVGNR
jgi:hypothetical protein